MKKPFTPNALARRIREVMDSVSLIPELVRAISPHFFHHFSTTLKSYGGFKISRVLTGSKLSVPDTDNRRQSPRHRARHEVCLTASISLLDVQSEVDQGGENELTLYGRTHDLSDAGVSLVVPFLPIDETYCREEGHRLPVTLYLPTREVTMQVAPVRCLPLDEEEPGRGFFMGAQIIEMDEEERACLLQYLNNIQH